MLSITAGGNEFKFDYSEDRERLLVRTLWRFRTPDVPRHPEIAHRLVQLLDLDFQKLHDRISANDPEIFFDLPARLAVVWTPPSADLSETPTGVVCPMCQVAISCDRKVPRASQEIFSWCPKTGYDKRSDRLTYSSSTCIVSGDLGGLLHPVLQR
jgi:hypothetical protein